MSENKVESVSSVLKVFSILQALSEKSPVSLSELEASTMMSKSTIYRFLQTMCTLGYVGQDSETDKYFLTLELFHIGARALYQLDLQKLAAPIMRRISDQTNETVHLGEVDRDSIIYTHKVESNYSLRMGSQVGRRADIYSTAMGKVLTALGPESSDIREALKTKEMIKHTEKTIDTLAKFEAEVTEAAETGFGYDREENEPNLFCIAVPIYDHLEQAIAAMSVSFPTFRCDDEKFKSYQNIMKSASIELSTLLGSKTIESVFS